VGDGGGRAETLTVLFTDLVDSTALRSELGEEPFDRVRHDHDALVTGAIDLGGGRVVKSTGDGVMAAFNGAADAVGAAVAVQQAIHAYNARVADVRLAVRIGLSVGDVTIEDDGDCFGLPVVEAQRLEAAAAPGQILSSSLVRELARGRGDHRFAPMGLLELKGLNEAVATDEVQWEPLALDHGYAPTMPPLLRTVNAFEFAGRTRELAVLVDAWKASLDGPGHLVLLAGEPGIGKTRLVTELAGRVLDQGGLVLAGRCDEDLSAPYGPVAAALTTWAAAVGAGADLGEWPGELVRMAPELADSLGLAGADGDGSADPSLLIRAVRSWLAATAAATPTLLVFDDLHWADAGTLLVVRSLFDRAPLPHLLVVGTYRDTDLDRRHPLAATLADLRRHDHVTRVSVEGLDEHGVAEFMQRAAGFELDTDKAPALARAVWEETAGNPFFVGEVLRHLAETGAIVERDGVWTTELDPSEVGIPEGIREVVGRRLSRLSGPTEQVLSAAAVIGLEVDVDVLVRVLGSSDDDVLDALEGAEQAALMQEVTAGRWRFAHGIVRETLLDELSSSRRVRQHRKVAAAIEELAGADLDGAANQLAYHWGEAAAGGVDVDKAFAWGIRAGDLAVAKPAVDDAIRWYEHALGLLDPDDPMPELECAGQIRLARAQALLAHRHPPARYRAAELALQLGDHEQLTDALVVTGATGYTQNEALADRTLIAQLEAALEVVGADEPSLRARLVAALALELQSLGEGGRRTALVAEALALAQAAGTVEARLAAEIATFFSLPWRQHSRASMQQHLEDLLELQSQLLREGDDYRVASLVQMVWWYGICLDRPDVATAAEQLERDLVDRRPTPMLERTATSRTVMRELIAGDITAVGAHLRRLEQMSGDDDGGTQVQRYCTALEVGLAEATIEPLERALAAGASRKMVEAMLALAWAEIGEVDRASSLLDAAVAEGPDSIPDDTLASVTIGMWLEVCVLLGRADLADAMQVWADSLPDVAIVTGVMYLGSPYRSRAGLAHLRGDDSIAADLYARAVAANESMGAVSLVAATKLDWASMLVDSGDLDGARALVDAALADLGDRPLVRRRQQADAVLARLS
jgi:class 3 adenylate cyclase